MSKQTSSSKLTLPRSWPCRVRSAMLHVVALAQYAAVYTRMVNLLGLLARDLPNKTCRFWHNSISAD
jgi:hypothetical protein